MGKHSFARWLQAEIDRREWSGSDLARKVRIAPSVVSRWLRGETKPNPHSCDLLADVLNADVDYVLTLAGHRPKSYDGDDPETRALIQLLRRVKWTNERRKYVRSLLEDMVSFDRVGAAK